MKHIMDTKQLIECCIDSSDSSTEHGGWMRGAIFHRDHRSNHATHIAAQRKHRAKKDFD